MSRFQAPTTSRFDEELSGPRDRLSRAKAGGSLERIELTAEEVERLAEVLDGGFSPTAALRKALSRLADPKRRPPRLHWKESTV